MYNNKYQGDEKDGIYIIKNRALGTYYKYDECVSDFVMVFGAENATAYSTMKNSIPAIEYLQSHNQDIIVVVYREKANKILEDSNVK